MVSSPKYVCANDSGVCFSQCDAIFYPKNLYFRIFSTIFKDSENETLIITIPSSGYMITFGNGSRRFVKAQYLKRMFLFSVRMMLIKPFRFCLRMATDPKMGLAESYMYGEWIADPSPKELLSVLIRAKRESKAKGNCGHIFGMGDFNN